jgi:uncharacterized protein (TIGR02453 family)
MASSFPGFSRELPAFFRELGENNTKAWFDEHRQDYQRVFAEPAKQFVAAIEPKLRRISRDLQAEPRVNGSIMRVNRDTRFSKDKTPYKTNLSMIFPEGPTFDRARPAFLMQIDVTRLCIGAGQCAFSPEQLELYRGAVAHPKTGAALEKAISKAAESGYTNVGGKHYKRVPQGFDADDPRAELLRHAGLDVGTQRPLPNELFTADAVDYCVECFRKVRPVQKWLVEAFKGL